jgi:hypothetical protein
VLVLLRQLFDISVAKGLGWGIFGKFSDVNS